MEVKIANVADKVVASLKGRLDTAASTEIAQDIADLMELTDKDIVLDCTELDFISSSGLRIFLNLRKSALTKGGRITIKNPSDEIKQVFTITGFTQLFEFE